MNRAPVLNHNGVVVGQSKAINRYLSKQLGFMGSTADEEGEIDALVEHVSDMKDAWRKLIPYGNKMSDKEKQAATTVWFSTTASPVLDGKKERQLQWFLGHLEGYVGDKFAIGGRPSLADAVLFNALGEHAPEIEGASGQPYGDVAAMTATLANFPKLLQVVETFKASPGMQHYLATRAP